MFLGLRLRLQAAPVRAGERVIRAQEKMPAAVLFFACLLYLVPAAGVHACRPFSLW